MRTAKLLLALSLLFTSTDCTSQVATDTVRGKLIREVLLACQKQSWHGVAFARGSEKPEARQDTVILRCESYLKWWKREDRPSPFSIKTGVSDEISIPPQEWQAALRFLPVLSGTFE